MTLKYIFHLSDLHIRNGDKISCRYDEYNDVFNETIKSINKNVKDMKLSYNDFIIIISGDIFHNKNIIGNYGLLLYKTFIQELVKINKVYIMHGNHDFNQSEINHPTLVSSSSFNIDNLTILDKSTTFNISDVGFSYVSIDDTLDIYRNSGRIQDLPTFPEIIGDVKYKIALFHGSFQSAKICNGESIRDENNPYPLEWVKNFDYVILGDIHKRQTFIYKKKTYCGYSGSLIQQSFGENIIEHGYLIWDLKNKKINEINVYNNIGYINIKENESEEILIRTNGVYEILLENFIKLNLNYFPKNIKIKTFSKINFQNLNNLLKSFNISFDINSRLNESKFIGEKDSNYISTEIYNEVQMINIVDNSFILNYFNNYLSRDNYKILNNIISNKDYLLFDISKYPDDLQLECLKRNRELSVEISKCIKCDDIKQLKPKYLIRYLEWDGLFCYENKNWLNITDLDLKTFLVKGKNGTGKSAIYDILTLAIWGEITTLKKNSSLSSGIINFKKSLAYTIVDIEIDDVVYRIERDFAVKKDLTKLNFNHRNIYKFINEKDLELLKKDSACEQVVKQLFGTIDNFLSSSMITQNVDYDILKMDYKECLEIIDKSCNIEYIYHLYNLFKTTINKYKDFRRIVESKKQVYEKLVSTNKVEEVNDEEIINNKNKLELLLKQKDELKDLFESTDYNKVDIKNPKTLLILDIDYNKLIEDLNKTNKKHIETKEEYLLLKEQFNELKYLLKDETTISLKLLKDSYNSSMILKDNDCKKIKPCELSIIKQEEELLKQYENNDNKFKDTYIKSLEEYKEELKLLNDTYKELDNKHKNIISKKPNEINVNDNDPKISKEVIMKNIKEIFENVDDLHKYISLNIKESRLDLKSNLTIKKLYTYEDYKKYLEKEIEINKKLKLNKEKLIKLENDFKLTFSKQQTLNVKNKPESNISYKTSATITKELKKINIKDLLKTIANDEKLLNIYYEKKDKIIKLETELLSYNQELLLFTSKDDYKYNPSCEICCKRSWVCRIKELEIIINKLECDIKKNNEEIENKEDEYLLIYERNETNNETKNYYELLNEWLEYYKSKEVYDKITKEINVMISDKETINNEIINNDKEINEIKIIKKYFNNISYDLYDTLENIDLYEKYKIWLDSYEFINKKFITVKTDITNLEYYINYSTNIKPRIIKLKLLKEQYKEWEDYEKTLKIINAFKLLELRDMLEIYDKYQEYTYNNSLKPLIISKLKLYDDIKDIEVKIKSIENLIIKSSTINAYNKENKESYDKLFEILTDLNDIINTLEIIITNFQAFRIDMYDKHILNKLTERANKIIKSLCHNDTKPFKLDYFLTVLKDNIHINWLINNEKLNEIEKDSKQLISINQASGFQHFVISLALRMSLFVNKQETMCNQLFIDEGFINFDKENLSIVPSFIKSLLSYFNNIVIVSHIDLIQDNIDEIAEIKYNKINSVSSMEYGNYKKVIKKRNKGKQQNKD
jgi:DNA repair protein SbcC/Rad50